MTKQQLFKKALERLILSHCGQMLRKGHRIEMVVSVALGINHIADDLLKEPEVLGLIEWLASKELEKEQQRECN